MTTTTTHGGTMILSTTGRAAPSPSATPTSDRQGFGAMADDVLARMPEWAQAEYGADNLARLTLAAYTWYAAGRTGQRAA